MSDSIFYVNDEPYCVWDEDLPERTREFLSGLDPTYFHYAYRAHLDADLSTEDERRAAVALKLGLHHALETFFSLVGALVQAPDCPFAWISKCSTPTLRSVIERIHRQDPLLFTKLRQRPVTWNSVAVAVFSNYQAGSARHADAVKLFAEAWKRMALEFLRPQHADEYNSMKHGFRVGTGGFKLEFAPAPPDGSAPPQTDFLVLGDSKYGVTYMKVTPLTKRAGERSLIVERHAQNWSIDRIALMAQMTYLSIANVVTALKIGNGFKPSECAYVAPTDLEDLLKAWTYSTGVTDLKWSGSTPRGARPLTRAEIEEHLDTSRGAA